MNVTERIQRLFKDGVQQITIGEIPDRKEELYLKVTQAVATGPNATNHMELVHQVSGEGFPEMIERAAKQVAHVNELKGIVVELPRN